MIDSAAVLISSPGTGEIVLILAVILLLFGAHRLPSIARSLGRALEKFRRMFDKLSREIMSEIRDDGSLSSNADPPPPSADKLKG